MDQRSDEWFSARLGKVTASGVADVMARTKSGPAASRENYMMQLLCERLTGRKDDGFTTPAMQRGVDLEPLARSAYEVESGLMVVETGLCIHPKIPNFGASPDGLVGDDGLLEIKCPNTKAHVEFLRTGKPAGEYIWQMMAQMACTDRRWCDFVSFDDRMPEPLQFKCVRIHRDEEVITSMISGVLQFLAELDALEAEMRTKMEAA